MAQLTFKWNRQETAVHAPLVCETCTFHPVQWWGRGFSSWSTNHMLFLEWAICCFASTTVFLLLSLNLELVKVGGLIF